MRRRLATAEDVAATARVVQNGATNYFAEQHQNIDEVYRLPLEALARGQAPEWTGATRRWLRSRGYIDAENKLRVPLFHQWLKERLEDDE